MKLKKETFRWPRGQDKITSWCLHALGFVYRKRKEMPARVVASSCHRGWGAASLCMNTRCVLQEDSSESEEAFKSTLFFPCGKIFVQLQTCTLFHKFSMFFLTFHHVRLTNNSGLSLHNTDWKSTLRARFQTECSKSTGTFTCLIQGSFVFYCVKYYSTNKSKLSHNLCCQYIASTEHSRQ